MAKGQMQLAMEETEERKSRDERAIRWLVNNLTEDAEMESFAMAIPGSFHTEWGIEVWKRVAEGKRDEDYNEDRNPLAMRPPTAINLPARVTYSDPPSSRTSTRRRRLLNSITRLTRIPRFTNSSPHRCGDAHRWFCTLLTFALLPLLRLLR